MDWLSLPVPIMLGPDFLTKPPAARAVWLSLLAHCALRESGGAIFDARSWSNRDWDRLAGTNVRGIQGVIDAELAWWEGDDLHVAHYPVTRESVLKHQRASGHEGGVRSGEARRSKGSFPTPPSEPPSEGSLGTPPSSVGKVGKVKESKREGDPSPAPLALTPSGKPPEKPEKPPKQPSAVTQLREAFERWYLERYGSEYYWTGKDGGIAKDLLQRAGERGIAEVIRRAQVLGGQKRDKAVTLGLVQLTWNELPSTSPTTAPAPPPAPTRDPLNPEPFPDPAIFHRPGLPRMPVDPETVAQYAKRYDDELARRRNGGGTA